MLLFHILFQSGYHCCGYGNPCVDFYVAGTIFCQDYSKVFEAGHIIQWFAIHGNADTDVACAVHHYFGFLCFDFHPIYSISFIKFIGQVLQFSVTAWYKVNIIRETQVSDRSTTDRHIY